MNITPASSSSSPVSSAPESDPHVRRPEGAPARVDATGRIRAVGGRALVLGGGGSTGNAWLIGVVAGLSRAGVDVTTADLTIGTSAGATAAAQLAGATPAELLSASLVAVPPQGPVGPDGGHAPSGSVAVDLERFRAVIASSEDLIDLRRRMGAAALDVAAASDGSWQARWRTIVAARLPDHRWPGRVVVMTAVEARTGTPVVFDRHSGVELVDAVAASTAGGGSAYDIAGVGYIDGGYRANAENADLAAGYARVLVLSPLGGRSLYPVEWGTQLAAQVDALRAAGSRVEVIVPDSGSEHLLGARAMDVSLRPAAARAGYELGTARAEEVAALWG
ncbi:patatin-like phospholipase family protein [uncultured Cellulomonas sp.]|uniref:patatin-like phospholipase family protein n=1 Tax=uncultured Cellulomonas sp. TaxID=189682 RepID=UPI0028E3B170|nr:patatin-like phospholipase family protein [uncultured Cellulomonas sp.]